MHDINMVMHYDYRHTSIMPEIFGNNKDRELFWNNRMCQLMLHSKVKTNLCSLKVLETYIILHH